MKKLQVRNLLSRFQLFQTPCDTLNNHWMKWSSMVLRLPTFSDSFHWHAFEINPTVWCPSLSQINCLNVYLRILPYISCHILSFPPFFSPSFCRILSAEYPGLFSINSGDSQLMFQEQLLISYSPPTRHHPLPQICPWSACAIIP